MVSRWREPLLTDGLSHVEGAWGHMDLAQRIYSMHHIISVYDDHLMFSPGFLNYRDLYSMSFIFWLFSLLSSTSFPSLAARPTNSYNLTMSGERGHGHHPRCGWGRGKPPTTLDDHSISTMFDHAILESIYRKFVAMEEEEMCHGCSALWAMCNLLAQQLK